MNVLCFGDSNTYGFDPRSYLGGRYPADARWVDLLASKTGWYIQNYGLNGREIPRSTIEIPQGTDLLTIMLGGNDLLQGADVATVVARMESFLTSLPLENHQILLIGPPKIRSGTWVPSQALIDASIQLLEEYKHLAARLSIAYASTEEWDIPLCFDGVHFTEKGHHNFSDHLYHFLKAHWPEEF